MKHKKSDNKVETTTIDNETIEAESVKNGESDEVENDESVENKSASQDIEQTSALVDSIMSDNRKIASLIGGIILLVGSYLSFWGVISDEYGRQSQGNLIHGGYMFGGILGDICIISAMLVLILIGIRIYKAAWYIQIVADVVFILQILMIVIFGWNVLGSGVKVMIYPGFGSIICLAGIIIMTISSRKIYLDSKIK